MELNHLVQNIKINLLEPFGKAGCFSLHPLKSLGAAGDGGFVVTNDKNLFEKIYRLRNHGQGKRKNGKFLKSRYDIDFFGFAVV